MRPVSFADLWLSLPERYGSRPLVVSARSGRTWTVEEAAKEVSALRPTDMIEARATPECLFRIWATWLEGRAVVVPDPDRPVPAFQPPEADTAAVLFTSGSTGRPKAIALPFRSLLGGAEVLVRGFGWGRDDRMMCLMAPHGISGLRNPALAALLAGATVVTPDVEPGRMAFAAVPACDAQGVTVLSTTPSFLERLLEMRPRLPADALSTVRLVICTGAPLRHATARAVEAEFGLGVRNYYGLTETGGICALCPPDEPLPGPGVVGRAAGAEITLIDGELAVRGPQVTTEGWFRTGDLAEIDGDGRIRLLGRRDDRIKSPAGEIVYPAEVEEILAAQPGVSAVAVLPYADERGEARLAAFVVGGAGEFALKRAVLEAAGPGRVPAKVFRLDEMPRVGAGKVDRQRLAKNFLDIPGG